MGLPTEGIHEGNEDHSLFELANGFRLVLYRRQEFLSLTQTPPHVEKSAGFIISYIADSRAEVDVILSKHFKPGPGKLAHN